MKAACVLMVIALCGCGGGGGGGGGGGSDELPEPTGVLLQVTLSPGGGHVYRLYYSPCEDGVPVGHQVGMWHSTREWVAIQLPFHGDETHYPDLYCLTETDIVDAGIIPEGHYGFLWCHRYENRNDPLPDPPDSEGPWGGWAWTEGRCYEVVRDAEGKCIQGVPYP